MEEYVIANARIVETQILLELVRSAVSDNEFLMDICDEIEDELNSLKSFLLGLERLVLQHV
jgi:hypothetical protein